MLQLLRKVPLEDTRGRSRVAIVYDGGAVTLVRIVGLIELEEKALAVKREKALAVKRVGE